MYDMLDTKKVMKGIWLCVMVVCLCVIGRSTVSAQEAAVGSVGGMVWHDLDMNRSETIDPVDRVLAGVGVFLQSEPGVSQQTFTDADGRYLFENLPLNTTYTVTIDTETLPEHKQGYAGSYDPDDIPLGGFRDRLTVEHDEDPAFPLSGVKVALVDSTGQLAAVTTTDETGEYIFTDLSFDERYSMLIDEQTLPLKILNDPLYVLFWWLIEDLVGHKQGVAPDLDYRMRDGQFTFTLTEQLVDLDANFSFVAADYGDLPREYEMEGYPAAHTIPETGGIYLGQEITVESMPQSSYGVNRDFDDGIIAGLGSFVDSGKYTPSLGFTVYVGGGVPSDKAVLGIWVDLNRNGRFEEGEFTKTDVWAGHNQVMLPVPDGVIENRSLVVRVRLFHLDSLPGGSVDFEDFAGVAINGEVEDIMIPGYILHNTEAPPVGQRPPTAVTLSNSVVIQTTTFPLIALAVLSLTAAQLHLKRP